MLNLPIQKCVQVAVSWKHWRSDISGNQHKLFWTGRTPWFFFFFIAKVEGGFHCCVCWPRQAFYSVVVWGPLVWNLNPVKRSKNKVKHGLHKLQQIRSNSTFKNTFIYNASQCHLLSQLIISKVLNIWLMDAHHPSHHTEAFWMDPRSSSSDLLRVSSHTRWEYTMASRKAK